MAKRKKVELDQERQADIDRIAARLRAGRTVLGLKPTELCRITGIAKNTYSQWENGKGRPPIDSARVLRQHFGYTLDWLYDGDASGLPMKLAQALGEYEKSDGKPKKSNEKAA